MISRLRTRQKNSLQPLLAMSMVLLLPVFLSKHIDTNAFVSKLFPNADSIDYSNIQFMISVIFVIVGISVWFWGSKKLLLRLILFYTALTTTVLILGLASLLMNITSFSSNQALVLMADAAVIWIMTVLTFSLWYWLLDSGWTEEQGVKDTSRQDFLFAQQANNIPHWKNWKPNYIEYLHLAFNTSTAFSPTDVSPLSHRVKVLMTIQSGLALIIISTVGAQAINILSS